MCIVKLDSWMKSEDYFYHVYSRVCLFERPCILTILKKKKQPKDAGYAVTTHPLQGQINSLKQSIKERILRLLFTGIL